MANRNYPSFRVYSNHIMPVSFDCQISIGAAGAPTISAGNGYGIASITRLAAGQYRLQVTDNFAKLLQFKATMQSPLSGGNVAAGALSPGSVYQITALGTTTQANWVTAGVPSGVTAAVGVTFLAAATSVGNGTAKLIGSSGIQTVELIGSNNNMLNNSPSGGTQPLLGGFIDFQCMGPIVTMGAYTPTGTVAAHTHTFTPAGTNANDGPPETFSGTPGTTGATAPVFTGGAAALTGTVAYVAADPANGSQIFIQAVLSNSSVQ